MNDLDSKRLISMSADQLWDLYEALVSELGSKLAAQKATLDERLRKLGSLDGIFGDWQGNLKREKRFYPKVPPKYRNPKNPEETWAGRGKQPRWLRTQLRSGRMLQDFRIERA